MKSALTGENRVMTIVFPDLCGYMAASKQAPGDDAVELVNAILGIYIDNVLEHGGYVARCIHDEVLALFGTPPAREDDPEHAVRAALAIRTAIRAIGLDVKIGINTGLVYFGHVGNAAHAELAVVGPAADVAARLVGKGDKVALPGEILVGASVERATRHLFEYGPPRVLNLKGIAEPITSHELLGPRAVPLPSEPDELRDRARLQAKLDALDPEAKRALALEGAKGEQHAMSKLAYEAVPRTRRAALHRELAIADPARAAEHRTKAEECARPFDFPGVKLR
jgi:adenylate cyclase